MSASSVISSSNPSALQALIQQRKNEFKTMASDVQSGNISGAQSALAALQQASANIQGVGGASGTQNTPPSSQLQINFANLINSMQSGGANSASVALSALTASQPVQSTGATSAAGATPSSFGQELTSLIQAVQSGDLAGAQQDLTQLLSDAKSQVAGHHHHHDADGSPVSGSATNSSIGSGTSTAASSSASAYASMMNMQATSPATSTLA